VRVTWFGQSAFSLSDEDRRIFIDPFGDMSSQAARGRFWKYPAIAGVEADLLLITHEHADHNAADVIGGSPSIIRSRAGTFRTPHGAVEGVASEHDPVAGTRRGANVILIFECQGLRVCHMGDFGQSSLRPEQRDAIGQVDLLFLPVGGTATMDGVLAASIVEELHPRWAVPMHYRTPSISFLDTAQSFLETASKETVSLAGPSFDPTQIDGEGETVIVVPAPPE